MKNEFQTLIEKIRWIGNELNYGEIHIGYEESGYPNRVKMFVEYNPHGEGFFRLDFSIPRGIFVTQEYYDVVAQQVFQELIAHHLRLIIASPGYKQLGQG